MCKFKHAFYFMLLACKLEHHISTEGKFPVSTFTYGNQKWRSCLLCEVNVVLGRNEESVIEC